MNDNISKILYHWGLQNSEATQIYDTAWQVGDSYVLKVYQNIGMLERNLKLLHILDGMNVPVGKIVPTFDNKQYVASDDAFYFITEKLPGNNIVKIENNMNIALSM